MDTIITLGDLLRESGALTAIRLGRRRFRFMVRYDLDSPGALEPPDRPEEARTVAPGDFLTLPAGWRDVLIQDLSHDPDTKEQHVIGNFEGPDGEVWLATDFTISPNFEA